MLLNGVNSLQLEKMQIIPLAVGVSKIYLMCLHHEIGFYKIFFRKPDLIKKNGSYFNLFSRYIYVELKG